MEDALWSTHLSVYRSQCDKAARSNHVSHARVSNIIDYRISVSRHEAAFLGRWEYVIYALIMDSSRVVLSLGGSERRDTGALG